MKLSGDKLCPHCGARQTIFKPLIKPLNTWHCPACGGQLYSPPHRSFIAVLACALVQFPLMLISDALTWRLAVILIVWGGFGSLFGQLALDVRVSGPPAQED